MKNYLITGLCCMFIQYGFAQTCCSGGVPMSNNLGLPVGTTGTIQFSLTYDLNVLNTLKTGQKTLEDDSRSRKTHATLFQIGYQISDKWSIDALASFIRQERLISQFGNRNFSVTNGIGDAILLFKYKLWASAENATLIQIGAGPKIPLGATDKKNEMGLALNADLQPGSGAWDGVFWGQFSHVLAYRPSMSFLLTTTYSLKGKNKTYFDVQTYQFGKEFQSSFGLSDRLLLGKNIIDPSILIRYRHQLADRIDAENLPSTGGHWIFIHPALNYWLSPDFSISAALQLPVFSRIVGTQVTPTYRFTVGVFYRIPGS